MKLDIKSLPITNNTNLDEFVLNFKIGENHSWFIPQALAYIAKELPPVKEGNLYSPKATLAAAEGNKFIQGLWRVLMLPRSVLITDTQLYKAAAYGPLVPLLLNAYKTYHNIKYSSWSRENLGYLVDKPLLEAITYDPKLQLTNEDWINIRNHGLLFRSGRYVGKLRNPATTAMLYSLNTYNIESFNTVFKEGEVYDSLPDLGSMPKLYIVMKAQIWCAHPDNRSPHMILDPDNWDNVPDPLISTEVLKKVNSDTPPWLL